MFAASKIASMMLINLFNLINFKMNYFVIVLLNSDPKKLLPNRDFITQKVIGKINITD